MVEQKLNPILAIKRIFLDASQNLGSDVDGKVIEELLLADLEESIQCERNWVRTTPSTLTSLQLPILFSEREKLPLQIQFANQAAESLGLLEPGKSWVEFYRTRKDRFKEVSLVVACNIGLLTETTEQHPNTVFGRKEYLRGKPNYNGDYIEFPCLATNITDVMASVGFQDTWRSHPGNLQRGFVKKYKAGEFVPCIRLFVPSGYFIES